MRPISSSSTALGQPYSGIPYLCIAPELRHRFINRHVVSHDSQELRRRKSHGTSADDSTDFPVPEQSQHKRDPRRNCRNPPQNASAHAMEMGSSTNSSAFVFRLDAGRLFPMRRKRDLILDELDGFFQIPRWQSAPHSPAVRVGGASQNAGRPAVSDMVG
jgi:hypothetical protein